MPTLPWTLPNPPPPHGTAFVMASRFEVRTLKDVPRFFLRSLAAWKQVRSAPGAYGASLIAQPARRVFYTLSAWQDRDARAVTRPPARRHPRPRAGLPSRRPHRAPSPEQSP